MGKRIDDALNVRDAALAKVCTEGAFQDVGNSGRLFIWQSPDWPKSGMAISLRTPLEKFPGPSNAQIIKWALRGLLPPPCKNLPYGLDVWAKGKVLNIEWDDNGQVNLLSFKRGPWVDTVLSWAPPPVSIEGVYGHG